MKSAPFAYHAPASVDEALALLAAHGDEASVLAGGQSLLPLLAMRLARPAHLVDIHRLDELHRLEVDGEHVVVGAAVTQRRVERDARVAEVCPLLADAVPWIGHAAIRNRGTVGGSLCHADPAAELPVVCVASGATMTIAGASGRRTVAAAEFFEMPFTTAVQPGELLVDVHFPVRRPGERWAFLEVARRHGDFPLVSVAVAGDAIALGGVAGRPVLVADVDAARDAVTAADDIHATHEYRRHLAGVLVERALARAAAA